MSDFVKLGNTTSIDKSLLYEILEEDPVWGNELLELGSIYDISKDNNSFSDKIDMMIVECVTSSRLGTLVSKKGSIKPSGVKAGSKFEFKTQIISILDKDSMNNLYGLVKSEHNSSFNEEGIDSSKLSNLSIDYLEKITDSNYDGLNEEENKHFMSNLINIVNGKDPVNYCDSLGKSR